MHTTLKRRIAPLKSTTTVPQALPPWPAKAKQYPDAYSFLRQSTNNHQSPPRAGFLSSCAGGYMQAARCETLYPWLHGGHMTGEKKNPAIKKIAGFLLYWRRGCPLEHSLTKSNDDF